MGTGLRWDDILACARGEEHLAECITRRASERLDLTPGPLGLVGSKDVALLLGHRSSGTATQLTPWPTPEPVAELDGRVPAWRLADIERLRDDGEVVARTRGEMQRLLTTGQLADELGITRESLRALLYRKGRSVPQPDGRVGNNQYWTRKNVNRWKA